MQTVPAETVDAVWQEMGEISQEQATELARRMQEDQPAILMYLLAAEQAGEEEGAEQGWLLELGAIVCEAMQRGSGGDLPEVTTDELDAAEQENIRYLEGLEEGSEMDYETAVGEMIEGYNQMPLLGSILEYLMGAEVEPDADVPGGDVGMALLRVKTVIDCFDR